MDSKIVNPSNDRSGGLIMFWKKEIKVELLFSAPKYIDIRVVESDTKIWRLTGIYGEPRWEDKYKTWDKLRQLKHTNNLPWIVIGDFNEILFSHEKEGGNVRPHHYMDAFRNSLMDCGLEDIGFSGEIFTWKRGRIRERLDRAVANGDWLQLHPGATLAHLEYTKSDHRPLLLDTEGEVFNQARRSRPKNLKPAGYKRRGSRRGS
jgi:hypothetical protein